MRHAIARLRMSGARAVLLAVLGLATLGLSGCTQTSRVGDNVNPGTLTKSKTGVAVMRLSAAAAACKDVGVWLGVRDGHGFRRTKPVVVANERSLSQVPVAEVELEPGEYHVVSYACTTAAGLKMLQDNDGDGPKLLRSSYASFSIASGEIVNVGYFHINASRTGRNVFGRPVRTVVTITDWPLAELDRFKAQRPQIYAQMTTRLMKPSAVEEDDCERLVALKAEGKVQNIPDDCAQGAASALSAAKVVKQKSGR